MSFKPLDRQTVRAFKIKDPNTLKRKWIDEEESASLAGKERIIKRKQENGHSKKGVERIMQGYKEDGILVKRMLGQCLPHGVVEYLMTFVNGFHYVPHNSKVLNFVDYYKYKIKLKDGSEVWVHPKQLSRYLPAIYALTRWDKPINHHLPITKRCICGNTRKYSARYSTIQHENRFLLYHCCFCNTFFLYDTITHAYRGMDNLKEAQQHAMSEVNLINNTS
jgi:hypothetical protein